MNTLKSPEYYALVVDDQTGHLRYGTVSSQDESSIEITIKELNSEETVVFDTQTFKGISKNGPCTLKEWSNENPRIPVRPVACTHHETPQT